MHVSFRVEKFLLTNIKVSSLAVWQAGHTQTKSLRYSSAGLIDLVYCWLSALDWLEPDGRRAAEGRLNKTSDFGGRDEKSRHRKRERVRARVACCFDAFSLRSTWRYRSGDVFCR
jgi:hypothetical protein